MKRGFSLVEVVMSVALIAAGLLLIVVLIPSGVLSLKKAEDLQTATAYGCEVLETSRFGLDRTPYLDRFTVTLNGTDFDVRREHRAVAGTDGRLHDVLVTVTWHAQPDPIRLSTRMPQPTAR